MSTVVVVTTYPLTAEDASELVEIAGGDAAQAHFQLAVPEEPTSSSMGAVVDDWELGMAAGRGVGAQSLPDTERNPGAIAQHDAEQVLAASVQTLRDAGASAEGVVTPNHPLESIGDMVAHHNPEEVVVMIRHHRLSELTASDLAAKIKRHFDVPTLRVKAH
jgi:nucleotide-binding universal stress UspA family protein